MLSRFDPNARTRAANMTSYVAIAANILLTVVKVNLYMPLFNYSILLVILVIHLLLLLVLLLFFIYCRCFSFIE